MFAASLPSSVPASPAADETLMLASKAGDTAAFTTLARRYASRLVSYCIHFTRSAAAAEEVAQDTWLGLWMARASYLPSSKFVVFLFTAARNRCRNAHRSNVRARTAFGQPSADDVDALPGAIPSGLERVLAVEQQTRLDGHIDQLTPNLREALVLRVVDELSYADVGAVLEIPEATARTRVHQAIQKLRELERKEVT